MAIVPFDRSVLKVNQAILMVVIVLGYLVGFAYHAAAYVIPALAVMMLAAVASPALNLPRILYVRILRPSGVVRPRVVQEDPAPHRFAQLLGGIFLTVATIFVATGLLLVAWVLAWIVVAAGVPELRVQHLHRLHPLRAARADGGAATLPCTGAMILLLAPLIAVAVVTAAALVLRAQRGSQQELVGSVVEPPGDAGGLPSILYFTGVACTICHTAQKPALRALAATDDRIAIREVDIADDPELAGRYRVMSLPTTIVLDGAGQVAGINVGFASGDVLRRQLVAAGMPNATQPVG